MYSVLTAPAEFRLALPQVNTGSFMARINMSVMAREWRPLPFGNGWTSTSR